MGLREAVGSCFLTEKKFLYKKAWCFSAGQRTLEMWQRQTSVYVPGIAGSANVTVSPAERSHSLTLAHTHAHSHTRSHPCHGATVGRRHPSPHTRLPPRPVLTVAICIGGNFLQASSSSRPLQPPRVPLTLGPGFAPAGPPLPPRLSSLRSSPHSPLVSGARPGTSQRERGAGVCVHRPPSSCSAHCTW